MQTITGPRMIPYVVERSRRLRRMYLHVDNVDWVTLKLPFRHSEKLGQQFIREQADWICEMLDAKAHTMCLEKYMLKHPRLALGGFWYRLDIGFSKETKAYRVDTEQRRVRLSLDPGLPLESQLKQSLKAIAGHFLYERVRLLEQRVHVKAHGITIRDQKSRWGSCSETGGISLNWRLILIPPKLQDHVLLHELAHIRHFDHSRDFHGFLSRLDPRAKQHAKRLHEVARAVFPLGR